jgi:TRAP-type C4-dicarboxylate transport system permease small subunit
MNFLKILDDKIEEWILIVTYTAMLFIASAQVFFRYVINMSISWSQDLLTYMLIWSVFIGISLAVKKRKHIKVELAFVILPEKVQFFLKVFSNIVFMVFCSIFSYFALIKIHSLIFINPQVSESTGLSMWMIQIAVPAGFILSIYRLIVDTKLLFKERNEERIGG